MNIKLQRPWNLLYPSACLRILSPFSTACLDCILFISLHKTRDLVMDLLKAHGLRSLFLCLSFCHIWSRMIILSVYLVNVKIIHAVVSLGTNAANTDGKCVRG
eukprot:scaffold99829_cov18-Prasinocladus_malaysianus.AAC.1